MNHRSEEARQMSQEPLTFTLTIQMGNDGMQTPADVVKVLESVSVQLDPYNTERFDVLAAYPSEVIRDINGNTVGSWAVA